MTEELDIAEATKRFQEDLRSKREQQQRDAITETLQDWVWVSGATAFVRRSDRLIWSDRQWRPHFAHLHPKGDVVTKVMRSDGLISKFETLTYEPGGPEVIGKAFNLWRPSGVVPREGDVSWFLDHVRFLFPGDEQAQEYLLDYMSLLVREPQSKILFAVLIYSKTHGTGKTLMCRLLTRMLGKHNVVTPSPDEMISQFTAWQEGAQLAVVNELMMFGRQQLANRLKSDITEDVLRIRAMHRVGYSLPNHLNYFCTSNHANALLLENTDRRWLVLHGTETKESPEYYQRLVERIDSEDGPAAVLHYLQNREVKLNPKSAAPSTIAKSEMQEQSLADAEAYVLELFEEEQWPFDFDLVRRDDLVTAVQRRFPGAHKDLLGRMTTVLRERLGAVQLKRCTNLGRARPSYTLWSVRNHEQWEMTGPAARIDAYVEHQKQQLWSGFEDEVR